MGATDVWLPRGPDGRPTAVDFAVSSGLRADVVACTAVDGSAVAAQYEDRKRNYLDTDKQCASVGLAFSPFVLEAHGGGLGSTARQIAGFVASAGAAHQGGAVEIQAATLLRRISIALQRETARAVVRRLANAPGEAPTAYPEAWAEVAA